MSTRRGVEQAEQTGAGGRSLSSPLPGANGQTLSLSGVSTGRTIRSGEWARWPGVVDYRSARLGEILVERLIWGQGAGLDSGNRFAQPGYIWFRFWLPQEEQIVEKYYDAEGHALGVQVDVCMPPREDGGVCWTSDLLLDIWIAPDGRVTVRNEQAFEQAVADGTLSELEVGRAEDHIRGLTGAIAQGRFPPPLVRNWQVDLVRIKEALQE